VVENSDQKGARNVADHHTDHYSDDSLLPVGATTDGKGQYDK
jgi:hypothetical protein